MAVHIRLARAGAKKAPFYRIVVTDSRSARDGRFIENIGTFDPSRDASFRIDQARLDHWKQVGAQPSATVAQIIKRFAKAKASLVDRHERGGSSRAGVAAGAGARR